MTLTDFLLSYQAGLTVLGCMGATEAIKRALGERAKRPGVKATLPLIPIALGAIVGAVPLLPGEPGPRLVVGALLGGASPALYRAALLMVRAWLGARAKVAP
ncbi:MAG: hypothetical protein Q8Q14_09330 [Gemmatimonadales bacterium]|nr:hypothetical protein [Gemmatimonadales bacterium]